MGVETEEDKVEDEAVWVKVVDKEDTLASTRFVQTDPRHCPSDKTT